MAIAPNSKILICKNVRLDNTYEHTIKFSSHATQFAFFSGKAKFIRSECTYVRAERAVRLDIPEAQLYDCNYLCFQNTAYGDKWFYAFITGTTYINDNTTDISYEIDVMQTWAFDYQLRECFVEREHQAFDTIGDNLLNDDITVGEYVLHDRNGTNHINNLSVVFACNFDGAYEDITHGVTYGRVYSGVYYHAFSDVEAAFDWVAGAVEANKQDGILGSFMMPTDFVTGAAQLANSYEVSVPKWEETIDGYKPNNKKLFTYPYNMLYVTDLSGHSARLRYENFSGTECEFTLTGDMSFTPCVMLAPRNYLGQDINYDEALYMNDFPQCSYNTDTFKVWLNNCFGSGLVQSGVNAGASAVSGFMSGGVAGAAIAGGASILSSVAGQVGSAFVAATKADQINGSQGGNIRIATSTKDFDMIHATIKRAQAEIIDEYWDRYGYPCRLIKVPNTDARPHYTYTKVSSANITGSFPVTDLEKIKSIFVNGITFWKNGDEVGNFSASMRASNKIG